MGILNIEPVSPEGMRFLALIYGLSETGKTHSALLLAAGLEPNPRKRMLIDTEGGQRGRAYHDTIPGGYLYASLSPQFTPERHIEAINEAEDAGISTLVLDSSSHWWFAEGGILEAAEDIGGKDGRANFKVPKRRLSKLKQRILQSDLNIILCARAKRLSMDRNDGKKIGDIVPVQDKELWYDMSFIAQMQGDGLFAIDRPAGKCPANMRDIFKSSLKMTTEMGAAIAQRFHPPKEKSQEQRDLERSANEAAERGTDNYANFFKGLTYAQKEMILQDHGNRKSIAKECDEDRARRAKEEAEARKEEAQNARLVDSRIAAAASNVASQQAVVTATVGALTAATEALASTVQL